MASRKYAKSNGTIHGQDTKGNDVYIQDKPITEVNAYLKSMEDQFFYKKQTLIPAA